MEKGLSSFISHILALAISIIVLSIVAAQLFGYYRDTVKQSQKTQARLVAGDVGTNVIRLYTNYKDSTLEPSKNENLTLGRLELDIPEKISGRSYRIVLQDNDEYWIDVDVLNGEEKSSKRQYTAIKVSTLGEPSVESVYYLNNIGVDLTGRVRKTDQIILRYVRKNSDGNIEDEIIMERL